MLIAYIVVIAVLGPLLIASATGKLRRDKRQLATLDRVGVPATLVPWLAACEIAGAAGLALGIAWIPLGIAAAIGIIAYFVGAIPADPDHRPDRNRSGRCAPRTGRHHVRTRDRPMVVGPAPVRAHLLSVLMRPTAPPIAPGWWSLRP